MACTAWRDGLAMLTVAFASFNGADILQQPARGKSRALNLALEHVEGDLLVLTDDDVMPHQDWLSAWQARYLAGYLSGYRRQQRKQTGAT